MRPSSARSRPKYYGKYEILQRLGEGSFGEVWKGQEKGNPEMKVAIKLESLKTKFPQLLFEAKLYNLMQGGTGTPIPKVYDFGTQNDKNYLVMQLLGLSLEDLFTKFNRSICEKSVLMLATQMISAVQYVHSMNYIHRDVKPDNFVIGLGKEETHIYLIDFGLSKKYYDPRKGHIPKQSGKSLTGTARYASVNALAGREQSRRDDLESLLYVWAYLMKGRLPWMGLPTDKNDKYANILKVKKNADIEKLLRGFSPAFIKYFKYVKNLEFEEEPDYAYLRKLMFEGLIEKYGGYDNKFEWTRAHKIAPPRSLPIRRPPTAPTPPAVSIEKQIGDEKQKTDKKVPTTIEKKPGTEKKNSAGLAVVGTRPKTTRLVTKQRKPVQPLAASPLPSSDRKPYVAPAIITAMDHPNPTAARKAPPATRDSLMATSRPRTPHFDASLYPPRTSNAARPPRTVGTGSERSFNNSSTRAKVSVGSRGATRSARETQNPSSRAKPPPTRGTLPKWMRAPTTSRF